MKVIFVTRSMAAGGAERVIAQLAKYMIQKEVTCDIITLNDEAVAYELPLEVAIHVIGKKSQKSTVDKFLKYQEVRRLVTLLKPDIVLAMPEEIGIYVIPALWGTHIPVIVSERNNPWVMPWKKASRLSRKLFYPFATGFVFQTDQARDFFSGMIRTKSIILPNPLDLDRIPKPWCGERRKEIVGAGRMNKQKNFPLLIQAFTNFYKNHQDYVLTIYGEGELKDELKNMAAALLPEASYNFPGNTQDLLKQMNGATMFVLSSDFEGMPNVVIEAMAMGIPVISTDCPSGGSKVLIENGINGLLVPVGDVSTLSRAMSTLADSREIQGELGENALKIKKTLDSDIVAAKWLMYLKSHCSG